MLNNILSTHLIKAWFPRESDNYLGLVLKGLNFENKTRHSGGRNMAFCCDASFSEVRTKKETADWRHALIFFNYNIVTKMKTLLFNSLWPNTRLKRPTYG